MTAPAYADYHDPDGCGLRQRDRTVRQTYDRAYLDERYAAIDDKVRALSEKRLRVLGAFVPTGGRLLDYGCGTGRLVQAAAGHGWSPWGHDLVPGDGRRVIGPPETFGPWDVACFYDSLEHLPDPGAVIRSLDPRWVSVSAPNCAHPDRPEWFLNYRHVRFGEHLVHWNRDTLERFFGRLGYRTVALGYWEDAYRPHPGQAEPNILSAVFVRSPLPAGPG